MESHEGRPTKVEGNPQHPAGGASDVFAQASILDMYDPDRAQVVTYLGDIRTWSDCAEALKGPLNSQKAVQGSGLRILTRTVGSPTPGFGTGRHPEGLSAGQVGAVRAAEP